jgi:hypothetical protein
MERPKADSFTAFLEAKQRLKSDNTRPSAASTSGASSRPNTSPLVVLSVLAEAPEHQMPVTELMTASRMLFTDFADALKNLGELRYLELEGPPGTQVATLTPLGLQVSVLVHPD